MSEANILHYIIVYVHQHAIYLF